MSNQEPRKPRPYDPGDPERKAEAVALFLAYLRAAAELAQGGHLGSALTLATAAALMVEPWAETPATAPGFWSTLKGKVMLEARYIIPEKFCAWEDCDGDPTPGDDVCPYHAEERARINEEAARRLQAQCETRRAGKCRPSEEPSSKPLGEAPQPRGSDTPTVDLEPVKERPTPCLDPDKMHGAGDGFGGEDGFSSPAVEPWHPMKRVSFPVAPDLVPSAAVGPSSPVLGWSRESSFSDSFKLNIHGGDLAPNIAGWFCAPNPALLTNQALAGVVKRLGGEVRVPKTHYNCTRVAPEERELDEVRARLLVALVAGKFGGEINLSAEELEAVKDVPSVAYYTTEEGDYILSLPRPKGSPAPNPAL